MQGDIYTRQKCRRCGGRMVHDPKRRGLFCLTHPSEQATGGFFVKFGRDFNHRYQSYREAEYVLNGIRYEHSRGTYDPKDYRTACPYSFDRLASDYLDEKRGLRSFRDVRRYMDRASEFFGKANVKVIKRKDIKAFLASLGAVSDKTRHNYAAQLRNFFAGFLVDEEILDALTVPKFPQITYELGYRGICDMNVQDKIVAALRDLSESVNPKIWLAVELLRSYVSLRPDDLRRLTEGDVNMDQGALVCWRPTKTMGRSRRKVVFLMDEHMDELREMKRAFPALPGMPFFRHHESRHGAKAGNVWSKNYLYSWWRKACEEVGVKGLDLYGGTRHSTVTALALEVGADGAREATQHETNAAFDRYCQAENARALKMAQAARRLRGDKVVKMKEKAK